MKTTAVQSRSWVVGCLAATLASIAPAHAYERVQNQLTVFAAASLTDVLQEIGEDFRADTGITIRFSFAASSALARQIESGAPADVFVSADLEWMNYLQERSLIDAASRRNVAGNELVLIAPQSSELKLEIAPGFPLLEALGDGRLATGDPASVPAGRYARAALTSLGVWSQVESRLVPAENVRAALAYVSRGEVPLGIVYRTDARVDPRVQVVDAFPSGSHPPIVYPAAAVGRGLPMAAQFLEFLVGERARAIFAKHGFSMPPPATQDSASSR